MQKLHIKRLLGRNLSNGCLLPDIAIRQISISAPHAQESPQGKHDVVLGVPPMANSPKIPAIHPQAEISKETSPIESTNTSIVRLILIEIEEDQDPVCSTEASTSALLMQEILPHLPTLQVGFPKDQQAATEHQHCDRPWMHVI